MELCSEKDLSSYCTSSPPPSSPSVSPPLATHSPNKTARFTRSSVAEFITLFSKTVAERTRPGQRQCIQEGSYAFHCFARSEGVACIIISDHEYPALVAQQLLSKLADEFLTRYPRTAFTSLVGADGQLPFPQLKDYLSKYQDPQQADSIMKIQKELDETKIVLHKTIESVLERGEKIDSLVAKSDGLSAQSKMFYTQVRAGTSSWVFSCHVAES